MNKLYALFTLSPLELHDASRHHFASLKKDNLIHLLVFRTTIFLELFDNYNIYFLFASHFKSFSSTTSREFAIQYECWWLMIYKSKCFTTYCPIIVEMIHDYTFTHCLNFLIIKIISDMNIAKHRPTT